MELCSISTGQHIERELYYLCLSENRNAEARLWEQHDCITSSINIKEMGSTIFLGMSAMCIQKYQIAVSRIILKPQEELQEVYLSWSCFKRVTQSKALYRKARELFLNNIKSLPESECFQPTESCGPPFSLTFHLLNTLSARYGTIRVLSGTCWHPLNEKSEGRKARSGMLFSS